MEEEEDLGGIGVAFRKGEKVEIGMSDIEILLMIVKGQHRGLGCTDLHLDGKGVRHTLMPSSEKHGGTAEDSSSASERRIGNFSTADMGISPL